MSDGPWVRMPLADGGEWVDIKRLKDGRVACQLCCRYTPPDELHHDVAGERWDICGPCAWIARHPAELNSSCPCDCCTRLAYWLLHGRTRSIGDTCNCVTYLDKDLACTCPPCANTYRRGDP